MVGRAFTICALLGCAVLCATAFEPWTWKPLTARCEGHLDMVHQGSDKHLCSDNSLPRDCPPGAQQIHLPAGHKWEVVSCWKQGDEEVVFWNRDADPCLGVIGVNCEPVETAVGTHAFAYHYVVDRHVLTKCVCEKMYPDL